jgi:MFS transporter, DHA1 family, multidrug resistance protein
MPQNGCVGSGRPHVADPSKGRHGGLAVLLAALSMAGPFSIDTFFPSFHAIAEQFSVSAWAVQQTLTV